MQMLNVSGISSGDHSIGWICVLVQNYDFEEKYGPYSPVNDPRKAF